MSLENVHIKNTPRPIGHYSQAVVAGRLLFISGQIPVDPHTGKIEVTTIDGQTRRVLDQIEAILDSAGLTLRHVVKVDVYVQNLDHFPVVNQIYGERFAYPCLPARQLVQVARLPLDSLIEISCIATMDFVKDL